MFWEIEFWTTTLRRLFTDLTGWVPKIGTVLILLLIGWIVAWLIRSVLAGLLKRLKFDSLAAHTGVPQLLEEIGMEPSVTKLTARVAYWIVILIFVLAAAESLGIEGMTDPLSGLVDYLPNVLGAALILLVGGLIARLIGNLFGTFADRSGVRGGLALGQVVRVVMLVFVVVLALGELGVETTLLVTTATAFIASVVLALAVAFGWGSRHLARNIMAGFHAKEEFVIGQRIQVHGHTGKLISIGPIKAVVESESGKISLPNSVLVEEDVIVLVEKGETA